VTLAAGRAGGVTPHEPGGDRPACGGPGRRRRQPRPRRVCTRGPSRTPARRWSCPRCAAATSPRRPAAGERDGARGADGDALAREHPEFAAGSDLLAPPARKPPDRGRTPSRRACRRHGRGSPERPTLEPSVAVAWLRRLFDVAPPLPRARGAPRPARCAWRRLEAAIRAGHGAHRRARRRRRAAGASRCAPSCPLGRLPGLERCGARFAAPRRSRARAGLVSDLRRVGRRLAEARGLEGARRLRCGRCGRRLAR